ncbi:MAG TPA: multiheme c-type cytochrome [Gemmataceae bacterium]|jgi:nitrate/TMAO reductase-like tetraheme cytochrome c subunit
MKNIDIGLSRLFALGLLLLPLCGLFLLRSLEPALMESPPSREPELSVHQGFVTSADGPLAGARVRLQATAAFTRTDVRGRFRLHTNPRAGRVTAGKEGYFIGGVRLGDQPLRLDLRPLPEQDARNYSWVDPSPSGEKAQNCANCHAEIYREWSLSGHARAASGRRFRNLYEGTNWDGEVGVGWGLVNEHPNGISICASCHAPAIAEDDEARFDLRQLSGVAAKGVHCDYCHKIATVDSEAIGLAHGRFALRLLRPKEGQLFFGPLDDVDRGEDAYTPLYHQSRYCASCHEGIVFGVPVYTTYSEWLESPARQQGKQCQDCHMVPTGRMGNLAPGHGGRPRDPLTLANHRFFDGSKAEMLRRCLKVDVSCRRQGLETRVVVRVWAEDVGHRIPTGFLDRHLILSVDGRRQEGESVAPLSGPALSAEAGRELNGWPGRLYAKLYSDFDGTSPAPFWRPGPDPRDNRLRPGQTDELVFVFPAAMSSLRVRLVYRRFWQEVAREKGWPDRDVIVSDQSYESFGARTVEKQ